MAQRPFKQRALEIAAVERTMAPGVLARVRYTAASFPDLHLQTFVDRVRAGSAS